MPIALITGATAGIGAEFARQLSTAGYDLVLVARNAERLAAMSAELGGSVEVIAADLQDAAGLDAVAARVAASVNPVDMLVNNAGYGITGEFEQNPIEVEVARHALLVDVPFRLMHAALGQMVPRHTGTIVNIASVAAYVPRGTYGAAKAWVINFSRWANIHYQPSGITVTAVAPGFVHTEFHDRASINKGKIPRVMWLDAPFLVRSALRDVRRGKAVSIPSIRYKTIIALTKVLPSRLLAAGAMPATPSPEATTPRP
jgi:short-subunit dehydrogenase